MKKFTIPCSFGDKTAPFDVYIGNPKKGHHPLQHQSTWLSKERGGNVPPEVMESFGKLLDLAEKHNVSFEELCVYALKAADEQKGEKISGGVDVNAIGDAPQGMPQVDSSPAETSSPEDEN